MKHQTLLSNHACISVTIHFGSTILIKPSHHLGYALAPSKVCSTYAMK
jgi:hypothetical protein